MNQPGRRQYDYLLEESYFAPCCKTWDDLAGENYTTKLVHQEVRSQITEGLVRYTRWV